MAETRLCPQCGAELPAGAPEQPCPACLMKLGLESWAGQKADAEPGPTQISPPGSFEAPQPEELAALFPQLEILELLGHGGMGAVYKARQKSLDRLVALKIIKPDAADDPGFAERFSREAKALARLSHPNIVTVHDFGEVPVASGGHGSARVSDPADNADRRSPAAEETSGQTSGSVGDRPQQADRPQPRLYYFLMEYIDGVNLRQAMEAGRLEPEQALKIVPSICDALQYAHDEGIVHRDIKPENVLLDQKGRVKIADFGLAKLLASGGRDSADVTLTQTHQVMGTPRYMAPEQMLGSAAVDHRADIYSLGVVFYELLTGEVPLGRFEPPSHKVQVDVRLDEVVLRALAREPEKRYQHASDVKTDVETISASVGPRESRDHGKGISAPLAPGSVERLSRRDLAFRLAGIAICFIGICLVFLPWARVWAVGATTKIDPKYIDADGTFSFLSGIQAQVVFIGYHLWQGIFSGAIFLVLGGQLLVTLERRHPALWWYVTIVLGALAVVILSGAVAIRPPAGLVGGSVQFPVFGEQEREFYNRLYAKYKRTTAAEIEAGLRREGAFDLNTILSKADQGAVKLDAAPRFAPWLSAGLGMAMLVLICAALAAGVAGTGPKGSAGPRLSGASLRAVAAAPATAENEWLESARQQVRGPAIGLFMTGVFNWIGVPAAVILLLLNPHWHRGDRAPIDTPAGEAMLIVLGIGGLIVSGLIMFAALKMKRLEAYRLAVVGSVLAMVVTPGNVVGLPVGVWALSVLLSRTTREAFRRDRDDAEQGRPPKSPAEWWLSQPEEVRKPLKALLGLALLGLAVVFIAPSTRGEGSALPGETVVQITEIGAFDPWIRWEHYQGPKGESGYLRQTTQTYHFLSWSMAAGVLAVMLAFLIAELRRIDDRTAPEELEQRMVEHLRAGDAVRAIRTVRASNEVALSEARRIVEEVAGRHGIEIKGLSPQQRIRQIAITTLVVAVLSGWLAKLASAGVSPFVTGTALAVTLTLYVLFLIAMWAGVRGDRANANGPVLKRTAISPGPTTCYILAVAAVLFGLFGRNILWLLFPVLSGRLWFLALPASVVLAMALIARAWWLEAMEKTQSEDEEHASANSTDVTLSDESKTASDSSVNSIPSFPPGSGPRLLALGLGFVITALVTVMGVGFMVYGLATYVPDEGGSIGWLAGGFGALIGGAGGLFGCWNNYRKFRGAGDLMRDPHWNWVDSLAISYGFAGLVAIGAGIAFWPALDIGARIAAIGFGSFAALHGAGVSVWRMGLRRSVRQKPGEEGLDLRLMVIAAGMVLASLMIAGGVGLAVIALVNLTIGSAGFWGWMAAAFGLVMGGVASLMGVWDAYRHLEGAEDLLTEGRRNVFDRYLWTVGGVGVASLLTALIASPWISRTSVAAGCILGGVLLVHALSFLPIRALIRRAAEQESASLTERQAGSQ